MNDSQKKAENPNPKEYILYDSIHIRAKSSSFERDPKKQQGYLTMAEVRMVVILNLEYKWPWRNLTE